MPITSSAKKAVKVSARRALENSTLKTTYKLALKQARKALLSGEKNADTLVRTAQSSLDKAVKTKLLHRNTASRLQSRLAHVKAVEVTAKAPVKKAKKKA